MSETTNVAKISGLLEAIDKSRIDLSNDAKELFSEGKITFDQYKEMINQIQTEVCSNIKEITLKNMVYDKELEEKRIEYERQLQEKQMEINSKPKTFMQMIDDFGYKFMKGAEAFKM